jgi:hypothetical protein
MRLFTKGGNQWPNPHEKLIRRTSFQDDNSGALPVGHDVRYERANEDRAKDGRSRRGGNLYDESLPRFNCTSLDPGTHGRAIKLAGRESVAQLTLRRRSQDLDTGFHMPVAGERAAGDSSNLSRKRGQRRILPLLASSVFHSSNSSQLRFPSCVLYPQERCQ